ncbi:MAG: SurA N-terminal domain-containing protein, partial [Thermomicrobiales bacterium]
MMDRIRSRVRPGAGQPAIARQRRTSRRERELRQRRLLYIGTGVVGVLAVLILIGGAAYQYYFYPRQDLASVNGKAIERRDYWKVRNVQLRQQFAQISQQYQFVPADQQPELQQRLTLISEELEDVEGAPVASDTLATMVDDLVVLQNMDEMGVTISDEEMEQFISEQFAPVPLTEPTATTTSEPTAAAWATQTSEAGLAAATESAEATSAAAEQTAT